MYSYLKCIVYDKLLKPRQSFWITLYLRIKPIAHRKGGWFSGARWFVVLGDLVLLFMHRAELSYVADGSGYCGTSICRVKCVPIGRSSAVFPWPVKIGAPETEIKWRFDTAVSSCTRRFGRWRGACSSGRSATQPTIIPSKFQKQE